MRLRAAREGSSLLPISALLALGALSSKEETSVMFLPWGLPVSCTAFGWKVSYVWSRDDVWEEAQIYLVLDGSARHGW